MVFLGNLVLPAATSKNNTTTAVPFSLQGYAGIEVRTTASDALVELKDSAAGTTSTAAATGYPLSASVAKPIAYQVPQGQSPCSSPCLAGYSAGGATVQVWGVWS
jgi:hypothetical protein